MSKATWGLPGEKVDYKLMDQIEKSLSMGKGKFLISHFPSFFQEGRGGGEDLKKQNKTEKKGGMKTKASFLEN